MWPAVLSQECDLVRWLLSEFSFKKLNFQIYLELWKTVTIFSSIFLSIGYKILWNIDSVLGL